MDRQLIFTNTLEHLRHQGHRSVMGGYLHYGSINTNCVYEAANGDRCAVGVHLESGKLEGIEGMSVGMAYKFHPELFAHLGIETKDDIDFLTQLQTAHDCELVRDGLMKFWELRMEKLAHQHGLVYTPPQAVATGLPKEVADILSTAPELVME